MKLKLLLAAAALLAGPVHAAVTVTTVGAGGVPLPALPGFTTATFDGVTQTTYGSTTPTGAFTDGGGSWSGGGIVMNNQGGGSLGLYAEPVNDTTNYLAVLGGQTETVTYGGLKSALGLYWGSIDSYNVLTLVNTLNNTSVVVAAPPVTSGDQFNTNSNRYFEITGFKFNQVQFGSTGNSFEFDNVATAAVPEPATWAMMLVGFGGLGAVMRSSRRKAVATAA